MHSVSSNAVAQAFGTWETLWSSGNVGGSIIKGIICNGTAFVTTHLQSYVCTSSNLLITTLPAKYRPRIVTRGCCFAVQDPLYMGFLNIESDGRVIISSEMAGKTIYGDCFIMIEKDV